MIGKALIAAKKLRANAGVSAAEAAICASADAADLLACKKFVEGVAERRAAAIASAKPAVAMKADSALMAARITLEIAAAKSAASTARHLRAVAILGDAESEVNRCAKEQLNAEMVALATEFNAAFDAALKLGERLADLSSRSGLNTPLAAGFPAVPVEVAEALARMPPRDPYNTPLHILRFGESSHAGARRLQALMTDDLLSDRARSPF